MNVEVQIIKELPVKQIEQFEDKTTYNCAVFTREHTKNANAYPYLSGELSRQEIAAPIVGSNKDYGLAPGVDYATKVWGYTNPKWTNPDTQPQWYYSVFNKDGYTIIDQAVNTALKEI